jgi:hypothetical protein
LLRVLLTLNFLIKSELLNQNGTAPCAPDGALGRPCCSPVWRPVFVERVLRDLARFQYIC